MSDVRVNDVMTRLVVALNPSDSMHHAAHKLSLNHISGAPVVEEGRVVGIVSESDLIHAVMPPVTVDRGTSVMDVLTVLASAKPRRHAHGKTVADAMNPLVIQVSPSTSIWKAASIMERQGVNRLPVVDNEDKLLGIVSRGGCGQSNGTRRRTDPQRRHRGDRGPWSRDHSRTESGGERRSDYSQRDSGPQVDQRPRRQARLSYPRGS